jgi:hypothetical protein
MDDAQRYRMNAAECLSAAERCELPYRVLTFAVAEAWLSLARQLEAINELLVIWSKASSPTSTVLNRQSFILSTFTGPLLAASARGQVRGGSTRLKWPAGWLGRRK